MNRVELQHCVSVLPNEEEEVKKITSTQARLAEKMRVTMMRWAVLQVGLFFDFRVICVFVGTCKFQRSVKGTQPVAREIQLGKPDQMENETPDPSPRGEPPLYTHCFTYISPLFAKISPLIGARFKRNIHLRELEFCSLTCFCFRNSKNLEFFFRILARLKKSKKKRFK